MILLNFYIKYKNLIKIYYNNFYIQPVNIKNVINLNYRNHKFILNNIQ